MLKLMDQKDWMNFKWENQWWVSKITGFQEKLEQGKALK